MELSLSFLGTFRVTLDGKPAAFATDRARALLAYLAVEADRPHRREALAGLLWPDSPESTARKNLSQALVRLRRAIDDYHADPPFLLIAPKAIQFNAATAELDIARLQDLVRTCAAHTHPNPESCPPCLERLRQAVKLYRGDFLQGLSVAGSQPFEEWAVVKREQLHRQALEALVTLARHYEARGDYSQVERYAQRQLALEPWREEAHRQLMRALSAQGQRSAALAQYRTCRQILADDMGLEPAAETQELRERIQQGEIGPGAGRSDLPANDNVQPQPLAPGAGLLAATSAIARPGPAFVGRERELARLDRFLHLALAGRGRVVTITGETGSGKTALAREFARRAQEAQPDLVVAYGRGDAQTGLGDPYLLFRQILGLLAGGSESRWTESPIGPQNAQRLSALAPTAVRVLLELGPDLLSTFVPAPPSGSRWDLARKRGGQPGEREGQAARHGAGEAKTPVQSGDLFQQYLAVLGALAAHRPLLLLLYDLQWADAASISLLFHLVRHIGSSRILLAVTYRPEDVALGWQDGAHPLREVIGEFKRTFGDIQVSLDDITAEEGRHFVSALLDMEPNQLDPAFRETLFQHTEGHALFTVELLREMQACGDLRLDSEGRWVMGPSLQWERLPARVEGVIERRFGRLAPDLRQALRVAAVEGEEFTAEVAAQVQGVDEPTFIRRLSAVAARQHRLVEPTGQLWLGTGHLSRYRFRHNLFQTYLVQTLDGAERMVLHDQVGRTLEALYGDHREQIAGRLARHFQAAGNVERASRYLRQAGESARRLPVDGQVSQQLWLLR